jgi:hypothetical protein
MFDYQEGYADGLAGAGVQDRSTDSWIELQDEYDYELGFIHGSMDRKTMLTAEAAKFDAFVAWCEGLVDEQP